MKNFITNDCFVFDLDGTIVDTSPDIVDSVRYVLKLLNLPYRPYEAIRDSIGGGAFEILRRNVPDEYHEQLNSIVEIFKNHYDRNCTNKSFLYPNVVELLEMLKTNKKKIAIYTFKTRDATNKILLDYDIDQYFDAVVTKDDVTKPKPDPEGIYRIMDILNYHTKEKIIMIGDTQFDVLTGKNANVHTLGVTFGYDPNLIDYDIQADFYIDNYDELLEIFEGEK